MRLLILALGCGLALGAAAETRFVAGTADLPLAPGLAPAPGEPVVFDKPGGRIVEAEARGGRGVSRQGIERFYAETLPALGWARAGQRTWRREAERLTIEVDGRDDAVRVAFTLSPSR